METPSSTRRVTRSETLISAINSNFNNNIPVSRKLEDSEKDISKSRPRSGVLVDITNDSPIAGLAMGKLETPSSTMSKNRMKPQSKDAYTPGSGEVLLRGQVMTLMQKVDEEASEKQQFFNPSVVIASPVHEYSMVSQMVTETVNEKKQECSDSESYMITRSLLFDFSEKSEGSDLSKCSSVLTNEGENKKSPATEDDDSSVWSIQVNTSVKEEDDDSEVEEFEDGDYGYENGEEVVNNEGLVDELCEGISKINVNGATFKGKHTRFVYNSDGEIEGEEECDSLNENLPTPKGKYMQFSQDNWYSE